MIRAGHPQCKNNGTEREATLSTWLSRGSACLALAIAACAGNALYAFGELGGSLQHWSSAIVAGALIIYMVVHGRGSYSAKLLLTFAVTVFLVGWSFETLSILTGFPFGNYHYTAVMAPFLGHVPVSVMPAYCVMGYVSWSMARILIGRFDGETDAVLRWRAPVVAAALMVVWDLSMDPLRATVEQRWVWLDGGNHLGVPLENYAGWALVTWVMFQSFALALPRDIEPARPVLRGEFPAYWLSVPLAYASFAFEYVLNPAVAGGAETTVLANSTELPIATIFREVAVLTASTMLPLALAAATIVYRRCLTAGGDRDAAVVTVDEDR